MVKIIEAMRMKMGDEEKDQLLENQFLRGRVCTLKRDRDSSGACIECNST